MKSDSKFWFTSSHIYGMILVLIFNILPLTITFSFLENRQTVMNT